MKKSSFLSAVILILISALSQLQVNARGIQNFNDTTSKTPKGTFIKNGRVNISPGYKVTFSEDKKIGTISKQNGNGVSGSFMCTCVGTSGRCAITTGGGGMACNGDTCCSLIVSTSTENLAITSKSGSEDANIIWKVLVIPKTNTTTTSN